MIFYLKKIFFIIALNSFLFLLLVIGIQNSSNKSKVNLLISESVDLPIGFIVGSSFSVADITAIVAVNFLRTIRVEIPEHLEFLLNWKATVSQRSSIGA